MLSIAGTKHGAFGFPAGPGKLQSSPSRDALAPDLVRIWGDGRRRRCTVSWDLYDARQYPREGGRGLSAKKQGESDEAGNSRRSTKSTARGKTAKKHRPGDLGRALRSVYDDTLREAIPDDFLNLIGKLS
jgi:hypothetical protein